jgi:lysophospholipase L1-like esterase
MAYSLSPCLKSRYFITGTNRPLAGGLLYTYLAGTTTNAATYSDNLGTPNTNPVVLDADGQCNLFLDDNVSYRIILKNSAGVTQFDQDRVASISSAQVAALAVTVAATAADRVQTGLDRTQTGADVIATAAARDAALLSRGVFATTAKALSNGVINYSSLVAGTGGTNGTFAIGFSGGVGTGAAGYFTVAGGSITSIALTATGDSYTSAPTMSFAASSGLTGASATAVIGANVNSGEYFSVIASTSEDSLILYLNNAGVAVEQKRYPSSIYATLSTEPLYVNGQQVMYSVVDSAGRALAYIGMDGVVYGKLPVTASSGIALTRIADGSYTLKLDAAVIDPSYGAVDYLAAICDSADRKLFTINLDGTLTGKLGVSASGGVTSTQSSAGVYNFALDTAIIDPLYGATDYLAAIVDSADRMLFSVAYDGTITAKLTVTELVTARGNRTNLDTRLSQNLTSYGMPKRYTWGEWYLRETRMRLRKRALAESTQLTVAMIGDSWTHLKTRYSGVVASTSQTAYGNAGSGWVGFGWGGGGASDLWASGNGNITTSEISVALTTGWSTHYNSSVSPDLADIYTSTAAAKVTTTFAGTGNVSVVNLFYIAGGSGIVRYRWNAGAWTTLDISAGSGLLTSSLASVPTSTWTLEIENVSGTTTICGIDVQKATDGVRLHKLGGTGSNAAQWAGVNATYWQNGLIALAPNLVTILLGTNDQGLGDSPAVFRANIQTMLTRIKAALPYADIMLIMPCENQRVANTYAMSAYATEIYELAAINKCAYLDLQYVFGDNAADYAFGTARAWFASDLIHPDPTTGGRVITDAIYRLLTTQ